MVTSGNVETEFDALATTAHQLTHCHKNCHEPENTRRKLRDEQLPLIRKFYEKAVFVGTNAPSVGQLIDDPQTFGPESFYCWDIRRVTVTTFTAGTVNMYQDRVSDDNLEWIFQQTAPVQVYSGSSLGLEEGERLVFVPQTGFTGGLTISIRGYQVPRLLWAEYLL